MNRCQIGHSLLKKKPRDFTYTYISGNSLKTKHLEQENKERRVNILHVYSHSSKTESG